MTTNHKPLELLTDSRMRAFRRCQMEHRLRYEEGLVPIRDSEALRFGTLVHKGLEKWWGCTVSDSAPEERLAIALEAMREHAAGELAGEANRDPFEIIRAEEMLIGYDCRWRDDAVHYEVLAVEAQFRVPLLNPATGSQSRRFELAGKLDVLVRDCRTGDVLIIEHKTTSLGLEEESSYWPRLTLDSQVSAYYHAAWSLGYHVSACIYDVLRKPAQRPLKATPVEQRRVTKAGKLDARQREADKTEDEYRARVRAAIADQPDKYYARRTLVRLEDQMRDFDRDLWDLAATMREAHHFGRAVRNPDACQRYGQTCAYYSICSRQASADDPTQFRKLGDVHPELSDAA